MTTKNDDSRCPIGHQLEYSIWSVKVSWCPICHSHFYGYEPEYKMKEVEAVGLTDYSQFTIFAEQQGCKFQGVIGMVPCEKRKHIRVESWELPESGGFVLMANEKTGQIGVYEFVGENGAPLIRDIEWLKNKVSK